jgi:hypothetical protein
MAPKRSLSHLTVFDPVGVDGQGIGQHTLRTPIEDDPSRRPLAETADRRTAPIQVIDTLVAYDHTSNKSSPYIRVYFPRSALPDPETLPPAVLKRPGYEGFRCVASVETGTEVLVAGMVVKATAMEWQGKDCWKFRIEPSGG